MQAFGVADGVGGSASKRTDPGLFSRAVLRAASDAFRSPNEEEAAGLHPALRAASKSVAASRLGGSSTVLLGQLKAGTDQLLVANLGDSGLYLLR